MCAICGKIPCDSRCPNAPDEKPEEVCTLCGNHIYAEDAYYESSEGAVCMDCLNEMTAAEALSLAGEHLTTA